MEQLLKKKKKFNVQLILYPLIIFFGFLLAFVFKSVNMLHATAFPNSSVTYDEGQVLYNDTTYAIIESNGNYYDISLMGQYFKYYYPGGTYSNGVITYSKRYSITSSNVTTTNNTYNVTINSDSIDITVLYGSTNMTILQTGYTEAQYLAYGSSQYTAGQNSVINDPHTYGLYTTNEYNSNYTAGQNSVLNSPNTYNLYTTTQYNNYGTSQYNAGYSAGVTTGQNNVLNSPNTYGLYTSTQYTNYGSSQYTAGQNAVINDPHTYNLYTTSEYNSYGTSQYNSGVLVGKNDVINNPNNYNLYTSTQYQNNYTAGQNSVINDPHTYNLYTTSEYNSYGTSQYNAGYLAGLNDNEAYQNGIQEVLNHPHDYDLYTSSEYNSYGTSQYNAGVQYVLDNLTNYNLYTELQYETYGIEEYQRGYNDGIESYNPFTTDPVFDISNIYYTCNNSFNKCNTNTDETTPTQTNAIALSSLATNLGADPNGKVEAQITLNNSYSINSTFYLPIINNITESNDFNIQFCSGYTTFYWGPFNDTYSYCKSVATNVPNEDTMMKVLFGIDDPYDNNGISYYTLSQVASIENNYYVFNLSDYVVGDINYFTTIDLTFKGSSNNNSAITNANLFVLGYANTIINEDSYNLGYQNGYTAGNTMAQYAINKSSYNNGYNAGYNAGTRVGDNSIRGLAETILTSPVNMFKTMFNVEFLDINLAGFILSIFTIIVVIWLIKRFL